MSTPSKEAIAREAAGKLAEAGLLHIHAQPMRVVQIIQAAIEEATEQVDQFWRERTGSTGAWPQEASRAAQLQEPTPEQISERAAQERMHGRSITILAPVKPRPSDSGQEWTYFVNENKNAVEIIERDEHIGYIDSQQEAIKIVAAHNASLAAERKKTSGIIKDWQEFGRSLSKILDGVTTDEWLASAKQLREQLAELEGWKQSQMQVAADTHYQEIGKEIDLTLGMDIAPAILPWIQEAKAQLAEAKAALERINQVAKQARDPHWSKGQFMAWVKDESDAALANMKDK